MKAGIFVGPQIRKLMQDELFTNCLNQQEKKAWNCFKAVVTDFLGNTKNSDFKKIVSDMLQSFRDLGCRMSVKLHFLYSHLDYFPEN